MTHLIDKDALVVEIEKWIKLLTNEKSQEGVCQIDKLSLGGRIAELQEVKVFLDTIEVKEVDLENKKMEWIEQLCKYFKANYLYVRGHESFIADFRMYAKNLK